MQMSFKLGLLCAVEINAHTRNSPWALDPGNIQSLLPCKLMNLPNPEGQSQRDQIHIRACTEARERPWLPEMGFPQMLCPSHQPKADKNTTVGLLFSKRKKLKMVYIKSPCFPTVQLNNNPISSSNNNKRLVVASYRNRNVFPRRHGGPQR